MRSAVLFLFLLNLVIGLLFLNEGLFHYDSVILAQAVEKTYRTGILQPSIQGRYGSVAINAVTYLPFFISGRNADLCLRLTSVLFHSLSIIALFLFIGELFRDHRQAFFASLFLSFTPFYFSPNTYGKEHGMSVFFLILSFYLLLIGVRRKSYTLPGIAGLIYVFSITVRESNLVFLPFFVLFYLYLVVKDSRQIRIKSLISFFLPLIGALCLVYFLYLGDIIHKTLLVRNTATNYFLGLGSSVLITAVGDLARGIPLALLFICLIGFLKMLFDKKIFYSFFFLCWFMLIFYFGNNVAYCPRHLDVIAIPLYIFASYVLSSLYQKYKIATASIVIYGVLSMSLYMYPMLEFRHNYNGEKQFALYVRDKTEDNAIIIAMDDSPFIEYYAHRKIITHPVGGKSQTNEFLQTIKGYLEDGIPVYLIESGLSYDAGGRLKNSLFSKFNVSIIGRKLTEDYHRPELGFQVYYEKLFKIAL